MRKLTAALVCRMAGTRLYGKPLQNLDVKEGVTILDNILGYIEKTPAIDDVVLGIAEGRENFAVIDFAEKRKLPYIIGDEIDALQRMIQCGHKSGATDLFRVTTECPFTQYELIPYAWEQHKANENHATVTDGLPEGMSFEIYTLESLETSHAKGGERHRSEGCSRYIREHRDVFRVQVLEPAPEFERMDVRLTVDYPEDLAFCRAIYQQLKHQAPLIQLKDILAFVDSRPDLKAMVDPYTTPMRLWP